MKNLLKTTMYIALIVFSIGCKQSKRITVNALSSTENRSCFNQNESFKVVPVLKDPKLKNNQLEDNTLLAKEIARKIEAMLRARGFRVDNSEGADYTLQFSCTMGSRRAKKKSWRYIFDKTSKYKKGASTNSKGERCNYKEESTIPGGLARVPVDVTYYDKKLDIRAKKFGDDVWQSSVSTASRNSDFRDDASYLIKGAFNYFGRDSRRRRGEKIKFKDDEVCWLESL